MGAKWFSPYISKIEHKIKYFKIKTYDNILVTKVVLLFTYWKKKIIFKELQLILYTENLLLKLKNALFWWFIALSLCQIWKNLLAFMNVDLKDYQILGAFLGNVFPWINIHNTAHWSNRYPQNRTFDFLALNHYLEHF